MKLAQQKSWLETFFILLVCYSAISFLLLPSNHLIGHPVYMDDYHGLSLLFNSISWHTPRPVFYFFASFFAALGGTGYYLLILFMIVLYAAAAWHFVQAFLERRIPRTWLVLYGVLVFSCPFIIEISKFLGMAINLCSALFSIAAMHLLLKGYRGNKTLFFLFAAIFYTVCLFTKEDFILPTILLAVYFFFFEKNNDQENKVKRRKLGVFLIYASIAVMGLGFFNKYIVQSVFTGMSASSSIDYAVNFAFLSILRMFLHYLTSNSYLLILLILDLLVVIFTLFFTQPKTSIKIVFLFIIIGSLILPYAVLPNHTAYFYIYNWLPWQSALAVCGLSFLPVLQRKQTSIIFIILISLLFILITYPHRHTVSLKYEKEAEKNRHMVSMLLHYKQQLNQETYVGVVNPAGFAAWLIGQGEYFRNILGLTPQWIVFVDNNAIKTGTFYAGQQINLVSVKEISQFSGMKCLYLSSQGDGQFANCKSF